MSVIDRPNSDEQRLQALEALKAKADVTAPADLAFSAANLALLLAFLPNFRLQMQERGSALSAQAESTKVLDKAVQVLRKYVSHFIQVFNLGVSREDYPASERAFFQLHVNQDTVPRLVNEQEVAMWAERIVTGDAARVAAGGAPMSNPTAAQVGVKLTNFVAAEGDQTTKKDTYDHEQEDVAALRNEGHALINDIWDEIEFTYRKDAPSSKRRKAREYGVVYVPNKGETPSPDDFSIMGKATNSANGKALIDVSITVVETAGVVLTDSHGDYFEAVLPPANYTLRAQKAGYQTQEISGVVVVAGAITTVNIQLVAVATGSLHGNVQIGGAFLPATVTIEGAGFSTTTDLDGNYNFPAVPAGPYNVRAVETANPARGTTLSTTVVAGASVALNIMVP